MLTWLYGVHNLDETFHGHGLVWRDQHTSCRVTVHCVALSPAPPTHTHTHTHTSSSFTPTLQAGEYTIVELNMPEPLRLSTTPAIATKANPTAATGLSALQYIAITVTPPVVQPRYSRGREIRRAWAHRRLMRCFFGLVGGGSHLSPRRHGRSLVSDSRLRAGHHRSPLW